MFGEKPQYHQQQYSLAPRLSNHLKHKRKIDNIFEIMDRMRSLSKTQLKIFMNELIECIKNWNTQNIQNSLQKNAMYCIICISIQTQNYSNDEMALVIPPIYINTILTHTKMINTLFNNIVIENFIIDFIKKYKKQDIQTILFYNGRSVLDKLVTIENIPYKNKNKTGYITKIDHIQGILSLMHENYAPLRCIILTKNTPDNHKNLIQDWLSPYKTIPLTRLIEEEEKDIIEKKINYLVTIAQQTKKINILLNKAHFKRPFEISQEIAMQFF